MQCVPSTPGLRGRNPLSRFLLLDSQRFRYLAIGLVAALAVILTLGAGRLLLGVGAAGCAIARDGEIVESQEFTPYDQRRTHVPEVAINPSGEKAPVIPTDNVVRNNTLDGLPLQWAIAGSDRVLVRYFLADTIGADVTASAFWAAGGARLDRNSADGWLPEAYASDIGPRAQIVDVGAYKGVLTWADPGPTGVRPHHLSWSDGTDTYTLIAVRSAAQIVTLARGLVCG